LALITACGAEPGPPGQTGPITNVCQPGVIRCNANYMRQVCAADGSCTETGFVCARSVTVDDETGGYCVTKGDGTYHCSGGNVTMPLPQDSYLRVQTSAGGLVGLTTAGRLVAPEMHLASDIPEATTFRATNMGGDHTICALFRDGTFGENRSLPPEQGSTAQFVTIDGTFSRAFCAYEGLMVGVRTDGTLLSVTGSTSPAGNGWVDVALSTAVYCALDATGNITCMDPLLSCGSTTLNPCVGPALPSFSDGPYRSITATAGAACALDVNGGLTCLRYDGVPMLSDAGPYTSVEAGQTVVCAIRVDGSVACFRHGGNSALLNSDPGIFVPIELPFGPDW
jgi:hypothetical protein